MNQNLKNVIQVGLFLVIFGGVFFLYQSDVVRKSFSKEVLVNPEDQLSTSTEQTKDVPIESTSPGGLLNPNSSKSVTAETEKVKTVESTDIPKTTIAVTADDTQKTTPATPDDSSLAVFLPTPEQEEISAKFPEVIGNFSILKSGSRYLQSCPQVMDQKTEKLCKSSMEIIYKDTTKKMTGISIAFIEPEASDSLSKIKSIYIDGMTKISITKGELITTKLFEGKYKAMVVTAVILYSETDPILDDMDFLEKTNPVLQYFKEKYFAI